MKSQDELGNYWEESGVKPIVACMRIRIVKETANDLFSQMNIFKNAKLYIANILYSKVFTESIVRFIKMYTA